MRFAKRDGTENVFAAPDSRGRWNPNEIPSLSLGLARDAGLPWVTLLLPQRGCVTLIKALTTGSQRQFATTRGNCAS